MYVRVIINISIPSQLISQLFRFCFALTGENLNEELLKAGLAWHYKYFDKSIKFSNLEKIARKNQKGIWSMPNPIAPWDFRRASKQYSY
ncbi:thermonuclease family protein [Arcticibacter pallidicorallinus]|uniref:thermonuclease family protein n=1 Tax=Arcticibacter pallidicorallinus TaxID=1259464 RepID=UPI000D0785D4